MSRIVIGAPRDAFRVDVQLLIGGVPPRTASASSAISERFGSGRSPLS